MSAGPRSRDGVPEQPSCKYPASFPSILSDRTFNSYYQAASHVRRPIIVSQMRLVAIDVARSVICVLGTAGGWTPYMSATA